MDFIVKNQHDIDYHIERGDDILFIVYSFEKSIESQLNYTLVKLLPAEQNDFLVPILSCIKELITNGIKGNIKKILTEQQIITDPDNLLECAQKIRSILTDIDLLKYAIICKKEHLSTRILFHKTADGLLITVSNNVPVSETIIARMQEKIDLASHYDNIAQFYMENPDPNAEGMGLGLSLIVVLLKGIGLSEKNFRIMTNHSTKTSAQIFLPNKIEIL